jgi:hypothetical protein
MYIEDSAFCLGRVSVSAYPAAVSAPGVPPVDLIVDVAVRVGHGEQPTAIAAELGVDDVTVYRSFKSIVEALPSPRHQFVSVDELRACLNSDRLRNRLRL